MPTIPLNRQFIEWRDGEPSDPDAWAQLGFSHGLSWNDLLNKRRAVVLAEAGSGKTEELEAQAAQLCTDGKFSFYAKVQDVGRDGLRSALRVDDRSRFSGWLASGQPGWLFIDSVDEAKLDGIRLERALRRIAEAIEGAERRAHIIISGRVTDWEFRRDLKKLDEELPTPADAVAPSPPTPDEMLISTIRRDRRAEPEVSKETALVVIMASLDADRVRRFARGKAISDLEAFMTAIEAGDLWRFARRPLDLQWLVDYWRENRRFGTLAQMLETSVRTRLQERNRDRVRHDDLDATRALLAVERIGAALVFGIRSTIAIPDPEIDFANRDDALDLTEVLPDWSVEDLALLLSRPIFDPATFGRVRLHNDNQGVVRGYLAACWLRRLREANLSTGELFGLIFAETYGVPLTKPSMRETAAWLAIHDDAIARELASREPVVLLDNGDPASLRADICRSVLISVVEALAAGRDRLPMLDNDVLKRFARPDLAETVRELWERHKQNQEVRQLLLRLVWLGRLQPCADLATESAFGPYPDRSTRLLAGRALVAVADDASKRRYAEFIVDQCGSLPTPVVWGAVDDLFPTALNVDQLLHILDSVDLTDREGGLSFDWHGPKLIERVASVSDLERMLHRLLELAGPEHHDDQPIDGTSAEALLPGMAAGAFHLLARSHPDDAPRIAIDCNLRLGEDRRNRTYRGRDQDDPGELLQHSAARRRAALWRASDIWRAHPTVGGEGLIDLWQMEMLGWSPKLTLADLDWLLADAPTRDTASEKRLAINAALRVWQEAGSCADVLQRIEQVARQDAIMSATFDAWVRPSISSPEERERHQRFEERNRRNALEQAARDQSWIDFIAPLRANPEQLRDLRPTTANQIDARLYHLWHLLSTVVDGNSRYAIESVAPLEPMLGAPLSEAVRRALIAFWRGWQPQPASERPPEQHNLVRVPDCIGIAGITLESVADARWAERLSSDEARRAATYATLELNGFPSWIVALAAAYPSEVADVLMREVRAELRRGDTGEHYDILQDLSHADLAVVDLVAPSLLEVLEQTTDLPTAALRRMLAILSRARVEFRDRLADLLLARFAACAEPAVAALYLGAAFSAESEHATVALTARLGAVTPSEQAVLVQAVLPSIFGDEFYSNSFDPKALPFEVLQHLVLIAYRTIRVEDDNNYQAGRVHSFDDRDRAEHARNAALNQFVKTPSRATYEALIRLAESNELPITPARLRELAFRRAAEDSESAEWPAWEASAFEATQQTAPRTPRDMQVLAQRRIADMQYELLHADFAQGKTLSALSDETAVQVWVADRLQLRQGRSYSVERESHVVDEKELDIRLRARASDASLPIEIKVAESWSVPELEDALRVQLCGRYLRAPAARHGILLLAHQQPRSRGWVNPDGGSFLTFEGVVERLRRIAASIASEKPEAPQAEIAVLDVSGCALPQRDEQQPDSASSLTSDTEISGLGDA